MSPFYLTAKGLDCKIMAKGQNGDIKTMTNGISDHVIGSIFDNLCPMMIICVLVNSIGLRLCVSTTTATTQ